MARRDAYNYVQFPDLVRRWIILVVFSIMCSSRLKTTSFHWMFLNCSHCCYEMSNKPISHGEGCILKANWWHKRFHGNPITSWLNVKEYSADYLHTINSNSQPDWRSVIAAAASPLLFLSELESGAGFKAECHWNLRIVLFRSYRHWIEDQPRRWKQRSPYSQLSKGSFQSLLCKAPTRKGMVHNTTAS